MLQVQVEQQVKQVLQEPLELREPLVVLELLESMVRQVVRVTLVQQEPQVQEV